MLGKKYGKPDSHVFFVWFESRTNTRKKKDALFSTDKNILVNHVTFSGGNIASLSTLQALQIKYLRKIAINSIRKR